MIKFSIPAIWQGSWLDAVDTGCVDEFYGSFDHDGIGSSLFRHVTSGISKPQLLTFLKKLNRRGLKLNYLLDATCIGNQEMTIQGQKKIRKLLIWLLDNNIDTVSISVPYLLEFIKYNYPKLKVYVSIMGGVDSLERAKYWDDLGADRITLSAVSGINRNFKLLRKIRESIKCQLELIANLSCLNDCPFWAYHSGALSHFSQTHILRSESTTDYCSIRCNYIKIKEPVEFIRSGWIRPEDLHYYEELGIDCIKLVNQSLKSEETIKMLKAYSNRRYEGNLCDLFSDRLNDGPVVYIDNQRLGSFLEHFTKEDCSLKSCQACNYCELILNKAVKIDDVKRLNLMGKYERQLDEAIGSL